MAIKKRKKSEITTALKQQPKHPWAPGFYSPRERTDTCWHQPVPFLLTSSAQLLSSLGLRLDMEGGMEARWQHTSQFRIPVYFLVFDKYKHWGMASIYSPSRPFPKESQFSSCYSNYNAQCPTNAKGGSNLGTKITPLAASVFIPSNRHYLRLMLHTEFIPNGHQAQAQRQWETSVTEEKHLNFPGSCQVTWHYQGFARPAWGKRASRVSASWKKRHCSWQKVTQFTLALE